MTAPAQWEVTDAAGHVHTVRVDTLVSREWTDHPVTTRYSATLGTHRSEMRSERLAVSHVALAAGVEVATVRRADDAGLAAARTRMSSILIVFEAPQASLLLALRGILDAEARNAVVESLAYRGLTSDNRKLAANTVRDCLTDLAAGRFDRINASDDAWSRNGCMGCWRAGFDAADPDAVCADCAAADEVVATIATVDAQVSS